MKYLFFIGLFFISLAGVGQTFGFPSILPGNNKPQITVNQGSVGTTTGFTLLTNYADTTAANAVAYVKNQPGIFILIGKSEIWMRNTPPNKWILVGGSAVDNNQWFGIDAFSVFKNGTITTATQNLAIGQNVLKLNTAGIGNTGLGFNDLANTSSGNYNTASGYISLRQNTTGSNNTANGANVLLNNTTGSNNTGTGFNSLTTLTLSSNNTASGYNSLTNLTTGASNTSIGANSLLSASIASWNSVLGDSVFFNNVSGHGNVGIGYQVGSNTGGDYNIFIGYQAGNNGSQMATPINSIAIGKGAFTTASNQIVIGNSSMTDLRLYGIIAGSGNSVLKYDSTSNQVFWGSPSDVSANNGIVDSSGRIILGGQFYKNTTINAQQYSFVMNNLGSAVLSATDGVSLETISIAKAAAQVTMFVSTAAGLQIARAHAKYNSGNTYIEMQRMNTNTDGVGNYFRIYGDSLVFQRITTNQLSSSVEGFRLRRTDEFSPAAAGMGIYMSYYLPTGGNVIGAEAGRSEVVWSDAALATRTSQFNIKGINIAAVETFANFQTAGIVRVNNLADTLATKAYVRSMGGGATTIYNGDGSLSGDRAIDLANHNLQFANGLGPTVNISSADNAMEITTFAGRIIRVSDDAAQVQLYNDANNNYTINGTGHHITADKFFLNSTLAGSVNGYVWTLIDNGTGEGAWVISSGGGGGSVNSVNVSGGTTGLSFSGGPVTTSGTITMAGTLGIANGGTNITSYAVGDLIYASGATTLSKLADVAAGSYLRSGGVTTAPVWSTLILPNAATINQIVYATSTNTYGGSANLIFDGNILTETSGVTTGTTTSSAFVGTYNGVTSGTGMYLAGSGSTSGNYFQIISTGTAKAANNEALDIQVSGANATNGITVTGERISVINTNATSGTNIAFATRASGATTLNLDLDMGIAGTAGGHFRINGLTSGGVTVQTANAAGTWTLTLPTTAGANNYDYLATDGTGVTRWQAGFNPTTQTLTDAVSITWNVNSGGNAQVTLGAAGRTLNITNPVQGYTYTIRIIQDGTGSRTITTWPTGTRWPNNGTAPTLTTTAGRYDIVTFYYDGSNYYGNYNFNYQ